ncbi:hypothetical protein LWF15_23915 [Kineosporia rhizophila]|uniref:hypothetical protein n=1 Tax=Kineosporia rhizophila TaxID=84633 RepID=UPI001E3CC648|nr:hypothetical protein [Kineosporia rhizophila]MCE0538550.1 hypothetical protein [Kineosporia rhizophila]
MRRLFAGLLGAALLAAPALVVSDAARADVAAPCSTAPNSQLWVKFASPKAHSSTDHAATGLAVNGRVTGKLSQKVTGVELFANGTSVGQAVLKARKQGSTRIRLWSSGDVALDVGHHVLVACATTSTGAVVGKEIHAYVTAPLGNKVLASSQPGDRFIADDGEAGRAHLSRGHLGCSTTSPLGVCQGGSWPDPLGVPKIWSHDLTRDGQNVLTFTKTFTLSAAQAAQPGVVAGWADDSFTVQLNGTEVLSGANWNSSFTTPVTLLPGKNKIVVTATNLAGFDQQGNPGGVAWKLYQN